MIIGSHLCQAQPISHQSVSVSVQSYSRCREIAYTFTTNICNKALWHTWRSFQHSTTQLALYPLTLPNTSDLHTRICPCNPRICCPLLILCYIHAIKKSTSSCMHILGILALTLWPPIHILDINIGHGGQTSSLWQLCIAAKEHILVTQDWRTTVCDGYTYQDGSSHASGNMACHRLEERCHMLWVGRWLQLHSGMSAHQNLKQMIITIMSYRHQISTSFK